MANAETPAEKSVQFINSEVLAPPTQDSIDFVKPYVDQTLAMALEDARSFLQGVEQILLVAIAKELAKLTAGPAGAEIDPSLVQIATAAAAGASGDNQDGAEAGSQTDDGDADKAASGKTAPETPSAARPAPLSPYTSAPPHGLKAIESVMASAAAFHASIAETALNAKREMHR